MAPGSLAESGTDGIIEPDRLLPPENATGNFVKVVQRVPVRIVFDRLPPGDYQRGLGMSVIPTVRVR